MIINTKYDLENLQNIEFPFEISDIKKEGFINYFKINDTQFSINNYEDYIKFGLSFSAKDNWFFKRKYQ